ncbi:hypothetical protein BHF71_08615 [Vulcanibacillus modesticaldus]|uniref:Purine nucleoside phosphorylase n=1 Tax=Vulcanibacillus modesticaldus TaxID=337097 RepID=A0A1D2YV69_9BACI|nr:peptidoglycan editing factor PgeF [Vulcanibacillus modesticaldus]OEF99536.1 hypothetical protein BHF71_08615 [Vulcanibacillus modesticaldus]
METFVINNDPLPHFTIPSWTKLLPDLSVGFSTRIGGQSVGNYDSMNLALHVGDHKEHVIANRQKLMSIIGFSYDAWTVAEQIHGNHIEIITDEKRGRGRFDQKDAIPATDGLLTDEPDILLTSYYADCVPLFFLDPKKRVVGLAHAGWKGTVLKIAEKMVEAMVKHYQSSIKEIRVAIGPSIGQCCYEVNHQVIDPLREAIDNLPQDAIIDKKNGHFDLDLKKINRQILINAGILYENIEISSLCTSCNPDLLFSYRRDQGLTGRMASWIGLRRDEGV